MDTSLLQELGLTESQAKTYLALVRNGAETPPRLAEITGESRTNTYMILDKLEELGLVEKQDKNKKLIYQPLNPVALEELSERRRKEAAQAENKVKSVMPNLLEYYYSLTERPGVRYLQGRDGLLKIYNDILKTKKTLYMVRTPNEKKFFGKQIIQDFIKKRIKNQIKVKAITPYKEAANKDPEIDKQQLFEREFFPEDLYTAPVEIDIYGDKVAFLSFGEDLTGVIIDNKNVANAMKQVLSLAKSGAKTEFSKRPELVADLEKHTGKVTD